MSDDEETEPVAGAGDRTGDPPWDSAEVMRRRAEETRTERDGSIGELRQSMTDDEVLAEFGIDLGEIEK